MANIRLDTQAGPQMHLFLLSVGLRHSDALRVNIGTLYAVQVHVWNCEALQLAVASPHDAVSHSVAEYIAVGSASVTSPSAVS